MSKLREPTATLASSRRELRALIGGLEVRTWQPLGWVLLCTAVATLVAFAPAHAGLADGGRWAMFIVVLVAGLWITEAISPFAVGLLVISLEVAILGREGGPFATGPDDWKIFIEPWSSPLVWLFFGGFVLARGIARSGFDLSLSLWVLRRCGSKPTAVLPAAMGITFVFSMFASNTATAAMMIAVLAPVVASRRGEPFARALLLGIAVAANLGGMGTIVGTPPNAIATGLLAPIDPVGFARWMTIGLPPALVLVVLAWRYVVWRHPPGATPIDLAVLARPADAPIMPRWRRGIVLATTVVTIVLWLTEPLHGASPPVVAFVPVAVFSLSRVLTTADIRNLEWDVLLLLAGGLSLGVAVAETGLAAWLVEQLPIAAASPLAVAAVLAAATVVLSNVMSHTAASNIMMPIAIALAPGSESQVATAVALAASTAMCLPVSTPPNALAFAAGELQTRDLVSLGLALGLLGTALVVGWTALVA